MHLTACLFRCCRHPFDAALVTYVEREWSSFAAQRLDLSHKRDEILLLAAGEDEVGSGLSQSPCKVLTETSTGSCHQSDLAAQIE
jgi:hypothetical protein